MDQPTPEEEEGEIKDEDEVEETHSHLPDLEPPTPPPVKKPSNKTVNKPHKKSGAPKKRKIEQIKTEPTQEQDDLDNSTLAKRKKR